MLIVAFILLRICPVDEKYDMCAINIMSCVCHTSHGALLCSNAIDITFIACITYTTYIIKFVINGTPVILVASCLMVKHFSKVINEETYFLSILLHQLHLRISKPDSLCV